MRSQAKRTQVACVRCKRHKKRCSGTRPCSYCIEFGFADKCTDAERKIRLPSTLQLLPSFQGAMHDGACLFSLALQDPDIRSLMPGCLPSVGAVSSAFPRACNQELPRNVLISNSSRCSPIGRSHKVICYNPKTRSVVELQDMEQVQRAASRLVPPHPDLAGTPVGSSDPAIHKGNQVY